jgi:hypothetical protein
MKPMLRKLRPCPCGCGRFEYLERANYKGFRIVRKPYLEKGWQFSAEKIQPNKLDAAILEAYFHDYELLVDDNCHTNKESLKSILARIKQQIDKFISIKEKIIKEVIACSK